MKFFKILAAAIAALGIASCAELDTNDIDEGNANIMNITVWGKLVSNTRIEYPSVIDSTNYVITVQVPYYLSDTEPIQGDLTKMTLRANLPQGATFNPTIAGQHDLLAGFETTLKYADGSKCHFTINAAYVKSDDCMLTGLKPADTNTPISISVSQPGEEGGKGKMMTQMSASSLQTLKQCVATTSPWATIEGDAVTYDEATGNYYFDFTAETDLVVVSQSGNCRTAYTPVFETPDVVDYGVGHIETLFSFQATNENTHGFERDCNHTMAVVDDYLLLSRCGWDKATKTGYLKSPLVYNRYNGELLEVEVNLEGIPEGRELRAITTDDAGHLAAMTFTCKKDMDETADAVGRDYYTTDPHLYTYVWENGITSAPTQITDLIFTGEGAVEFGALGGGNFPVNLGNTICVKGDLTSGDAVLMSFAPDIGRVITFIFKDGEFQKIFAQCPTQGTTLQWVGGWYCSKAIPAEINDTWVPYYYSGGCENRIFGYMAPAEVIKFNAPDINWWGTLQYGDMVLGIDVIDFNGARLMGVQNVRLQNSIYASRLLVSDIGEAHSATSFVNGFLFDSRENNDSPLGEVVGTGYCETGMLSTYPFNGDETPIGTDNIYMKHGDVVFAKTTDPNEVDVYMFNMNAGILAYKIQAYDL